ncbi:hypothetical protein LTR78_010585 [Recurvomyces mirabilis]|uniref:Prion-inhibition and propagation HeLo domain-containing protein n=1 Tax=Recurvomyces mirabilis TaxID=574656 RepID=A0AAE0WF04_9PEZI|nr:hypothetical protein LTR78_010585 [Recurvomyces mirabilis]KAK5150129.1 hypothetical protein LTS14_010392 [Recurvomyces mirabilis]
MDPASAAGLAIGVASLAFEVFDRSIKLFKFLSSVVEMPQEFERCRLQMMIEYNRLLAWGDAVGLVDVPDGEHVALSLGTNAVELCMILSRIGWLLEEFKDINGRWENEAPQAHASGHMWKEDRAREVNVREQVSSLAVRYQKNREGRKHAQNRHNFARWLSKTAQGTKEVVAHPLRIRWMAVDRGAFEALLEDLHRLMERLHELMDDYRAKKFDETAAKTFREIVVISNTLSELRNMLDAVTDMVETSARTAGPSPMRHDSSNETLQDLLRLKTIKCVSDSMLLTTNDESERTVDAFLADVVTVPRYDGAQFNEHFTHILTENAKERSRPYRPRGVFKQEGNDQQVWVEWRAATNAHYRSCVDQESIVRTATLAQMLSVNKPRYLFSPTCIGYVDARRRQNQFGWIFRMPEGSERGTTLETLHMLLGQAQRKPPLSQRISLAWKLASAVLYLHTVDWLHKGIHSANIIFPDGVNGLDVESPILSGFEYARPESNETTSRGLDPLWDIYRWPSIQNETPREGRFRKTYDIYSLGLVFLEIAYWQPLYTLVNLKCWPAPPAEAVRIRGWLLEEEEFPPFDSNPLRGLRSMIGDKYWRATCRCLSAHGASGMSIQENADQTEGSQTGIELQVAFTELVVDELRGVLI